MRRVLSSFFIGSCFIGLFVGCANKGGGPQGGPRDVTAPTELSCSPQRNATNARPKEVELSFNEYIQLRNAQKNIVLSPPQAIPPTIQANGKKVTVTFNDSLLPNTTYSINFTSAIADLNEGNVLEGYSYAFSTGNEIDTMQVSGTVLDAQTLNPLSSMTVGLYDANPSRADSIGPRFQMPLRVARTDSAGNFTIRNVKQGTYHIYALKDGNADFLMSDGESFAFLDSTITTHATSVNRADTLRILPDSLNPDSMTKAQRKAFYKHLADSSLTLDSLKRDTIIHSTRTRFLPDNLLLLASVKKISHQKVAKTLRPQADIVQILLAEPVHNPTSEHLLSQDDTPADSAAFSVRKNTTGDTISVFLLDSSFITSPEVHLVLNYEKPDSTHTLQPATDTLKAKYNQKQLTKQLAKLRELGQPQFLNLSLPDNDIPIYLPYVISAPYPISSIDTSRVHFESTTDSIWFPEPIDSIHSLDTFFVSWNPERQYRVIFDSAAVTALNGTHNKRLESEFSIIASDKFCNLRVFVNAPDVPNLSKAVLQLLSDKDEVVRQRPINPAAIQNGILFDFISPGDYFLRMFIDANGDGSYTSGDFDANRQPETTYYMHDGMTLRANWDVEQEWTPDIQNVVRMKPKKLIQKDDNK